MQKVLIVEDDVQLLNLLKAQIESGLGCKVDAVFNSSVVMDLLEKNTYILVLLDVLLPGQSGIDLLKEMKKIYPDLPAVMLSNVSDPAKADEARALGADDYLIKVEIERDDIVALVRRYM